MRRASKPNSTLSARNIALELEIRDAPQRRRSFAKRWGLSMKEVLDIERLCEEHGTTIMKIPAWLPKKGYGRIQSYLKTGK